MQKLKQKKALFLPIMSVFLLIILQWVANESNHAIKNTPSQKVEKERNSVEGFSFPKTEQKIDSPAPNQAHPVTAILEEPLQDEKEAQQKSDSVPEDKNSLHVTVCYGLRDYSLITLVAVDEFQNAVKFGNRALAQNFQKLLISRKKRALELLEGVSINFEKKQVEKDIEQFCLEQLEIGIEAIEDIENQGWINVDSIQWQEDKEKESNAVSVLEFCVEMEAAFEMDKGSKIEELKQAIQNKETDKAEKLKAEIVLGKEKLLKMQEEIKLAPEAQLAGKEIQQFCLDQLDKAIELVEALHAQGLLE